MYVSWKSLLKNDGNEAASKFRLLRQARPGAETPAVPVSTARRRNSVRCGRRGPAPETCPDSVRCEGPSSGAVSFPSSSYIIKQIEASIPACPLFVIPCR